jgi:hypothetical protein
MSLIGAVRLDARRWLLNGALLSARRILAGLEAAGPKRGCRSLGFCRCSASVSCKDAGGMTIIFARMSGQQRRAFASTDESLSVVEVMRIYAFGWSIEVFFKREKSRLGLAGCQPRRFDARIAHAACAHIRCMILNCMRLKMEKQRTAASRGNLWKRHLSKAQGNS